MGDVDAPDDEGEARLEAVEVEAVADAERECRRSGAAATAGWCSAWTAAAANVDGRRRRRDGRAGEAEGVDRARAVGAVATGEARKSEEAVAMASSRGEIARSDRASLAVLFGGFFGCGMLRKPAVFLCAPEAPKYLR